MTPGYETTVSTTAENKATTEVRALAGEPELRVCVLAACPFPANHGTPGSIRELSQAIARRGHAVHIVTYPFGEDIPMHDVQLHRVPNWFKDAKVTSISMEMMQYMIESSVSFFCPKEPLG